MPAVYVLKKTECRYRQEITNTNTRLQKSVCTPQFFAERTGFGAPDAAPILIVGLPRSGSTLIEQILASHFASRRHHGARRTFRGWFKIYKDGETMVGAPRYPGVLADLTAADYRRLGEKYLEDTKIYRRGKPFFIDKMPNNFRHLGLIHLMLPNAKIIDARREPMACCFGNYKQLFASGQQFTYSLEDIAHYYRRYVELMAHWDEVLPGKGVACTARGCRCGSRGERTPHTGFLWSRLRAKLR